MASDTEITKVRIVIRHLLWQIREVRKDRDAAWKWVNRFANTLQYQDLEQDPDQYALAILAEARSFNDQKKRNQQMRWVREQLAKEGVTSPTQEQLDEKWLEMYGNEESPQDAPNGNAGVDMSDAGNGAASKSPTSCGTFTADAPTREDSQDRKSGTSANLYGDAPRREAGEAFSSRESGALEPTTVSRNMRRVPQNEAPAHGFSGGRTAQGTMSSSPEAAAQSGKAYDQETRQVSTRDTREDSRGRYAPPSCSPDDGNPAETAPSHGGSVASLEARQGQALESQRRAGADSVRGTPSHRAPARSPARKFRNKEEFIQWAIDTGLDPDDAGNCWEATMERGGLTKDGKKVENLCAYAVKWCRTSKKNRETA